MPFVVILISRGETQTHPVAQALSACGVHVVTPDMPEAADGSAYRDAACVVVDLPGVSGLLTLRMMRHYGVTAPALLIADRDAQLPPAELGSARVLDVIRRPLGQRTFRCVQSVALGF